MKKLELRFLQPDATGCFDWGARVYELTFIDGKTFVYKFNNVDVNAEDGIDHSRGGYFFYIFSHKTYEHVEAVIRFKRIK